MSTLAARQTDRPLPGRILGHHLMYEIRATTTAISKGARHVVFLGKRAFTDNRTITLPYMSPSVEYEAHEASIMRGYSAHEAAHSRYTDWHELEKRLRSVQEPFEGRRRDKAEALYAKVSNVIDDMHIEREVVKPFPGTWRDLAALRGDAATKHLEANLRDGCHPNRWCAAVNVLLETCNDLNRWPCQQQNQAILARYAADAPDIVDAIAAWRERFDAIKTSTEGYVLAEGLTWELMALLAPDEEDQEEPNDAPDEDKAGEGAGEDKGEANGNSGDGEQRKPQSGGEEQDEPAAPDGLGDEELLKRIVLVDVADAAKLVAEQTARGEAEAKRVYGSASCRQEYVGVRHVRVQPDAKREVEPVDQSVARSVRRLAIATNRDRVRRHRESGDFDHRNVIGHALGTGDVYMTTQRSRGVDTAMRILVDQSGSTHSIIGTIAHAAASVAQAGVGLPQLAIDIRGFTDDERAGSAVQREVVFTHLKEFSDPMPVALGRMAAWLAQKDRPSAGTPTTEALLEAGYDLLRRPERRRIILLVTDGKPNNGQSAMAAADALKRKGIVACLLEIGRQAMPLMQFEHAAVAAGREEIGAAMRDLVERIMARPGG